MHMIQIFRMHSNNIRTRNRINKLMPHLPANLTVLVEDALLCDTLSDTDETVRKISSIDHPASETESAPGVAEMGGIGSEQEAAYAEFLGAALVHFVGAAVHEFVLVWFWVAREHAFEFHGLSCDHLRIRFLPSDGREIPPRE